MSCNHPIFNQKEVYLVTFQYDGGLKSNNKHLDSPTASYIHQMYSPYKAYIFHLLTKNVYYPPQ